MTSSIVLSAYIVFGLLLYQLLLLGFIVNGLFIHYRDLRPKASTLQSSLAKRLVYTQLLACSTASISALFDGLRRVLVIDLTTCSIITTIFVLFLGLGKVTVQLFLFWRVLALSDTVSTTLSSFSQVSGWTYNSDIDNCGFTFVRS